MLINTKELCRVGATSPKLPKQEKQVWFLYVTLCIYERVCEHVSVKVCMFVSTCVYLSVNET